MVFLFTLTSIVTAALLFLVQPMVARMVLPAFGGSPQVWTTAMLFFQMSLLAGYGYTHLATNRLSRRVQMWVHFVVLALPLVLLPIHLAVEPSGKGGIAPSLELLMALTLAVAPPFVVIATSGPLVQRWFSWTDHPHAHDPYFLYAAGNIGSIGGLLLYPFLIEPNLSVVEQSRWWMIGYCCAAGLLLLCAFLVHRRMIPEIKVTVAESQPAAAIGWRRIGYWILLAFVPSSLMLGVTAHLSTDVASIPMLWVLPLVAYLLTFTIAFSRFGKQALWVATWLAPAVVVAAISFNVSTLGTNLTVALQVLLVLVGGLIGHGKLAEDRPNTSQLTKFYLILSIGGALGGLFNSLIAPTVFPHVFEYGLIATATLALVTQWNEMVVGSKKLPTAVWILLGLFLFFIPLTMVACLHLKFLHHDELLKGSAWIMVPILVIMMLTLLSPLGKSSLVCIGVAIASLIPQMALVISAQSIERTFFGVHRVAKQDDFLILAHGTTIHGRQDFSSDESRKQALVYYHAEQPFGDLIQQIPERAHIGVIGLGAGTIAAYGTPQRAITFHEIDPAIVKIAEDQFSYLRDGRERGSTISVTLGDGRLTLLNKKHVYDLLVVDAFSSDSIPIHMLTVEAMQVYLNAIKSDGLIGIHISNRYLDLVPVLAGAATELNLAMLHRQGKSVGEHQTASHWVVVAVNPAQIETLRELGWNDLASERNIVWTDQRSSLWSIRKK